MLNPMRQPGLLHICRDHHADDNYFVSIDLLHTSSASMLLKSIAESTLCVSLQAGTAYVVDTTADEEACVDIMLQLAVSKTGNICGMSRKGVAAMNPAVLQVCHCLD